jgi:hypothetical protein
LWAAKQRIVNFLESVPDKGVSKPLKTEKLLLSLSPEIQSL